MTRTELQAIWHTNIQTHTWGAPDAYRLSGAQACTACGVDRVDERSAQHPCTGGTK